MTALKEETGKIGPILKRRLESRKLDRKLELYKENHLGEYFDERFRITGAYLGETLLKNSRGPTSNEGHRQIISKIPPPEEEAEIQEFLSYLKVLTPIITQGEEGTTIPAAQKMLQVNREIKAELLHEKHEKKMKMIKELKNQHNREMFRFLDDSAEKSGKDSHRKLIRKVKEEKSIPRQEENKSQTFKSKMELKTYFPNADPHKTPENFRIQRPLTQQFLKREVSQNFNVVNKDDEKKKKEEKEMFLQSFYQNHFFARNKIPDKSIRSASAFRPSVKSISMKEIPNFRNKVGSSVDIDLPSTNKNSQKAIGSSKYSGQDNTRPQTKAGSSSGRDWGFKPKKDEFSGILRRKNKPSIHEYSSAAEWRNYS